MCLGKGETPWDRDAAVAAMFPTARMLAGRKARTCPAMPPDELESAAMWGLYRASESFEPERGLKFDTHATPRIEGAMKDAMRKEVRSPGRLSLDDHAGLAAPGCDPSAALQAAEEIAAAMHGLDAGERAVIVAVYLDGETLEEAGRRVGRNKAWASKVHATILTRLREGLLTPVARRPPREDDPDASTLTPAQAARLAGVSLKLVRRWTGSGELPSTANPVTKHRRIRRDDLTAFLARRGDAREPTGPLLTTGQVAKVAGVNRKLVWRWVSSGRLPYEAHPASKRRRIRRDDLMAYLAAREAS